MEVNIEPSWKKLLAEDFKSDHFKNLQERVCAAYSSSEVYPHREYIFRALDSCPVDAVKVVILGQDPYHGESQANGLAFAVRSDIKIPPSLQNIYTEIENDTGAAAVADRSLIDWARQGVLLLNATMTVEAGKAGSHSAFGWGAFTDALVERLSSEREGLVFMLWGRFAQEKGSLIDKKKHCVLTAPHPSPLSAHRGFFGCKHFSKANAYLGKQGTRKIQW